MRHSRTKQRSLFAAALKNLLDDTTLYDRAEWADYLLISEAAISQWLHDKTVPRPDLLYMIYDTLAMTDGVPREPLAAFELVAKRPATEVSPLGSRMTPTVWEYMMTTSYGAIGQRLRKLDREGQINMLRDASMGPIETANDGEAAVEIVRQKQGVWVAFQPSFSVDLTLLPRLSGRPVQGAMQRTDWRELVDLRAAVLIGGPGSGKTAVLTHLADHFRKDLNKSTLLLQPIRVDQQLDDARTLQDLITDSPTDVLLIDGLDEMPMEYRSLAVAEIAELAKNPSAPQIFVSTRPISETDDQLADLPAFWMTRLTRLQAVIWLHMAVTDSRSIPARGFDEYVGRLKERQKLLDALCTPLFLKNAWSLFQTHGVTPFADAAIVKSYMQVLDDWDRYKKVVRSRESWASPQNISAILDELSYWLFRQGSSDFVTSDFEEWFKGRIAGVVEPNRLLRFLAEQTGVIHYRSDDRWEADKRLIDYLAASHIVSSVDDPTTVLNSWAKDERTGEILRLACNLTGDATPVLRHVMDTKDASEGERTLMLAYIVAQPLRASADVIDETCDRIVTWLDLHLKAWEVQGPEREVFEQPDCLWTLRAVRKTSSKEAERAWRLITPIHQARYGPASPQLNHRLSIAKAPVLRALRESMDVDGKLTIKQQENYADVSARVVGLNVQ